MIDPILYFIPASLIDRYRGHNLVVRSRDPEEIMAVLSDGHPAVYAQLLGLGRAIDCLAFWEAGVPLDLVIECPEAELPLLYGYAPLRLDRPVRVTVPLVAGFGKVVRLALSLDFAVKLEGCQPAPEVIEELLVVAGDYLHRSSVSVPVEFIHSLFMALYSEEPVSLWNIQEENPRHVRFITDQDENVLSKRLIGMKLPPDPKLFIDDHVADLVEQRSECGECEFLGNCAGYFKMPDRRYSCDGIKTLFRLLASEARELKRDLASYRVEGRGDTSG